LGHGEDTMIRLVLFLLSVAVIAAGFVWVADRPGDVAITWMGYRIETSLMVAALAIGTFVLVAILLWGIVRAILRSPEQVSLFFRHRRAMKGYLAITRGLIAVGAGNLTLARKSAHEAARLSAGDPLTLLLSAQSAQMAGDRAAAERAFRAMAERDDTKLLGLRGLYIEAQRRDDAHAARLVAERAAKAQPALAWAGQAMLDYHCAAADWAGALDALDHMKGALEKSDYRRKRAVLLTARALALEDIDRDAARAAVLEAVKLAPDLVPAAALAGRRLAESSEHRKARKILETVWTINPHPDIAEAYANLRFGDSARERLARMQKLADKVPGQLEGALAVARAALDATDFDQARLALAPFLEDPTQRVCLLTAEIEASERGDHGRAREWTVRAMRARRDAAWVADGTVSERWLPASPVTGKLDAFVWAAPAQGKAPMLEQSAVAARAMLLAKVDSAPLAPAPGAAEEAAARRIAPPRAPVEREAAEPIVAEPPLPDDPGPEPAADAAPRRFRLFDWLARPSA